MTPKTSLLPTFHRVNFGSSASKGVCINRREPPKLVSARAPLPYGRGVADPLEIRSSPTCYLAEFGRSRSNGTSVIKEFYHKPMVPMESRYSGGVPFGSLESLTRHVADIGP